MPRGILGNVVSTKVRQSITSSPAHLRAHPQSLDSRTSSWPREAFEHVTAYTQTLGISDDVVFPGPIFGEEKHAALSHADAFILASFSEGLPIAVLEAWSHGLPVCMTRECNLDAGFATGAAIEVTTNSLERATTLSKSLASKDLSAIGMRGRALVQQLFTWDPIVRELQGVYRWLAGAADRPDCVVVK
jgi:glycosyltransferase involved in cell wall biosynthesis